MKKTIGVLSVQGAFEEHINMLEQLDVNCLEIRKKTDLTGHAIDGLVLPGGESTVIGKLILVRNTDMAAFNVAPAKLDEP